MLETLLSHITTAAANGEPSAEAAAPTASAEEPKNDDAEVAEVRTVPGTVQQ